MNALFHSIKIEREMPFKVLAFNKFLCGVVKNECSSFFLGRF